MRLPVLTTRSSALRGGGEVPEPLCFNVQMKMHRTPPVTFRALVAVTADRGVARRWDPPCVHSTSVSHGENRRGNVPGRRIGEATLLQSRQLFYRVGHLRASFLFSGKLFSYCFVTWQ